MIFVLANILYLLYLNTIKNMNNTNNNNNNNNYGSFVPVKIYNNVDIDKLLILKDNKGKAGIYLWKHKELGKSYIGSAEDLSKRLENYFKLSYISDKSKNSYIYNAIYLHGYSAFSLTIIEHIDISNLSIDETRLLIVSREQYYLDSLQPEYNILKIAGSSLGYKHTEESLAKMSEASKGKIFSSETIAKLSKVKSGENNPMYGKLGENHPMHGKTHSTKTKAKMSLARGTTVYVYNSDKSTLVNSFPSAKKAAEFFNCSHSTILRYISNGLIFKDRWILSTIIIPLE